MTYEIGQLFQVKLFGDDTIHSIVAISVVERNPIIKIGLISLPFNTQWGITELWFKTIEWSQAEFPKDPMWNKITEQQFHIIKGYLFDIFEPISFSDYKRILNEIQM